MPKSKQKGPIARVNELAEKMGTTVLWDRTDIDIPPRRIICSLGYISTKVPSGAENHAGYGKTRTSAAASYLRKIVGQLLVKTAFTKDQQYFVVVPLGNRLKVIVVPKD